MKYDIVMIGHVSEDIMIYGDDHQAFTGGPVIYSSHAAATNGKKVLVVSKAADRNDPDFNSMRAKGIDVRRISSPSTTSIRNTYLSADKERRICELLSQADSFSFNEVENCEAEIFHLAGLFFGEIPLDFIPQLAKKGRVAVDAQGLLRCHDEGKLVFKNLSYPELLPHIEFLKTDAAEAEILTGLSNREAAAFKLCEQGAREVMVTHNEGVLICDGTKIYKAPFNPTNLSGRTGRGDTTFASYLSWRLDHSPEEAVYYAAALCSMKMEKPGPFAGTLEDVLARIEELKKLS